MAKNKKSFIAYTEWKETFEALPDEKAGQLVKHLFRYVTDENPQTEDVLINAVFANIRTRLKNDLKKYNRICKKRSEAGKVSAEKRSKSQQMLTSDDKRQQVNPDNDNDNDNVLLHNKKEIYKEKDHLKITWDEMNKLIDEFGEEKADDYINKVLNYRKNAKYKSLYLTALNWLKRDKEKSEKQKFQKPKLSV